MDNEDKSIAAFAWCWLNHTPAMFRYMMQDVHRDWADYLAGKYRLFSENPLGWYNSLTEDNGRKVAARVIELYDGENYSPKEFR